MEVAILPFSQVPDTQYSFLPQMTMATTATT